MARKQTANDNEIRTVNDYKTLIGGKLLEWKNQFLSGSGKDLTYLGLVGAAIYPAIDAAVQQQNFGPLAIIAGQLGMDIVKEHRKSLAGKSENEVAAALRELSNTDQRMLQFLENIEQRLQIRDQLFHEFNQAQQQQFLEIFQKDLPAMQVTINIEKMLVHQPPNQPTSQFNFDPAVIEQYLNFVKFRYDKLPLIGSLTEVDQQIEKSHRELSKLYTTLYTMNEREIAYFREGEFLPIYLDRGENRQSVLQAVDGHRKLVLLGDAGSGKSTFVDFLTICMAGALLHDPGVNLERLTSSLSEDQEDQFWSWGALLPIRIVLRDFAAKGLPKKGPGTVQHLTDYLDTTLTADIGCEVWHNHLLPYLRLYGGIILFDGLDEVSEENQHRQQIKEVIENFSAGFPKCHVLVTSRPYAYENPELQLRDFHTAQIAPFNIEQITAFIDRWYEYIGGLKGWEPGIISFSKKKLIDDIRSRDKVRELAARPLLLNLMAFLHVNGKGNLPDNLAELLKQAVDLLLDKWQRRYLQDGVEIEPSFAEYLRIGQAEMLRVLENIALQIHRQEKLDGRKNSQRTADIPESLLAEKLRAAAKTTKANTLQLEAYLNNRAGLIIPKGNGMYCFPHRSFQEYLAACALIKDENDYPDNIIKEIDTEPNRWREVLDLIPSMIPPFGFWSLFEKLYDLDNTTAEKFTDQEWWRIRLLGDLLLKKQLEFSNLTGKRAGYPKKLALHLSALLSHSALTPLERAGAGNALAQLGDPRFRTDLYYFPDDEWLGFKEIPAGPFLMGSNKAMDEQAYDNEFPQLEVTLPAYYMAKYPVTVGQWAAYLADQRQTPSTDWLRYNQFANHPVVMVSQREARKYCQWLNEAVLKDDRVPDKLQTLLRTGWRFRLPLEAEWEKAARGTEGRIYPYGNTFEVDKGNTAENNINRTTTVGCYPLGESPFHCEEMSGNVWEWTLSRFQNYPQKNWTLTEILLDENEDTSRFVIRGGCWFNEQWYARCAYRLRFALYYYDDFIGFRILLSPIIKPNP